MSMRKACQVAWGSITEPRRLKVTYFLIYIVTAVTGAVAAVEPPAILLTELGNVLSFVWAGFLSLGAVAGTIAVLPGWWWAERLGIYSIIFGALVYLGVVIYVDAITEGTQATQAGLTLVATTVFFPLRWFLIRPYSYEPRAEGRTEWRKSR